MPKPKAYLVHTYYEYTYIKTETYDTQIALKNFLRDKGIKFKNSIFSDLEEDSLQFRNGCFSYEIEESTTDCDSVEIDGRRYLSISEYCRRTDTPLHKAKYNMQTGKIVGIWIGKNHNRYILASEVRK